MMRCARCRRAISSPGRSWFDVHQYRIAAPEGVPMHWSRLVDIPIVGMVLLLRPLLGAVGLSP